MSENFNKEPKTEQAASSAVETIVMWFGRMLCKIGLHKWQQGLTDSLITPHADKCKRCKIVRVFRLWGYTYHYDEKDQTT